MTWESFAPSFPVIIGAGWILALLFSILASKRRARRAAAARAKDPDVQFLEGALEEDAPRKPNPNYSYWEFQRDLHDKGLTFEEIYEKCGGVFPKKPEQGQFGPQGYQGPCESGLSGCDGFHGYQGAQGSQGYQGPDGGRDQSPRMKELQQWFKEQGKKTNVGHIVPPPPNPYPIIHKIYIRGRR